MNLDWTSSSSFSGLLFQVEDILNELTPQNLENLVELVKSLDINTEEKLKGVTDLLFEKAINEPNLSALYASMCKHLCLICVPLDAGSGEVQFRKLVLTKCQKEFVLGWQYELKRKESIKATESADPEKLKELQLEFDDERKKMRMRQLGNIRFIGECFKLKILVKPIIHECIEKLLSESGEVLLECLCCLLKTVGKELDEKDKEGKMDQHFAQMQKIVDKRLTSSTIRVMLQDVIALRKDNWLITLKQIFKKEARRRFANKVFENTSHSKRSPDNRQKISDVWSLLNPASKNLKQYDRDFLLHLQSHPLSLRKPSNLPNLDIIRKNEEIKLGIETQKQSPAEREEIIKRLIKIKGVGDKTMKEDKTEFEMLKVKLKETEERYRNLELILQSRDKEQTEMEELRTELNRKDQEIMAMSIKMKGLEGQCPLYQSRIAVLEESLCAKEEQYNMLQADVGELRIRLEEKNKLTEKENQQTMTLIQERNMLTQEVQEQQDHMAIKDRKIDALQVKIENLENLLKGKDNQVDMGRSYLTPLQAHYSTFEGALSSPEEIIGDKNKRISQLPEQRDRAEPQNPVAETARRGDTRRRFLRSTEEAKGIEHLLKQQHHNQAKKLQFTVSQTRAFPKYDISIEEIKTKLGELLATKQENAAIFDWIHAKVSSNAVCKPAFIRALSQEVYKASITDVRGRFHLKQSILKKRLPLLTRYIGNNETLELQALYALQHLMNDLNHPKGVLRQIFDMLYDDSVISEEAFKMWQKSKDHSEQDGKAVALLSVRGFFTWMDSGDDEDSD